MKIKSMLLLHLSVAVLLIGCNSIPTQTKDMLAVEIVPESANESHIARYCRKDAGDFIVRLENPNALAAPSMKVEIIFQTTSGPVSIDAMSGHISGNGMIDVRFNIPRGCFQPDCSFRIEVMDHNHGPVRAGGICIG